MYRDNIYWFGILFDVYQAFERDSQLLPDKTQQAITCSTPTTKNYNSF